PYSHELEVALLAIIAEKLLDRIHPTRDRFRRMLSEFPSKVAEPFASVRRLEDIVDQVERAESKVDWFLVWRTLFVRRGRPLLRKEEIDLISSEDSVMGWTASNVIRRFDVG